jgi:hypothetical protein
MITDFEIDGSGNLTQDGELICLEVETLEDVKELYEICIEKVKQSHITPVSAPPPSPTETTETEIIEKKMKILTGKFIADEYGSNLAIHTPTNDDMDKVIKILEKRFEFDLSTLKPTYMKRKDVKQGVCGYLQGLTYNDEWLNAPTIVVKCCDEDKDDIHKLLGVNRVSSQYLWFPERIKQDKHFMKASITTTKYPIYVISKGRYFRNKKYQAPKTIQYLQTIGIDYRIVVEPQELENYAKSIHRSKIVVLPEKYLNKNQGGIPARNFVHHLNCADDVYAYWILDDNIVDYFWVDNNERYKVRDAIAFRMLEDCMDNFDNCYLSAHQYKMFSPPTDYRNVVQYNGRVFSSILIRTDIETLNEEGDIWRGKYNEDVDLSLRILKKGLPTILLTSLTCDKERTGSSKGGNTDSIYQEDGNGSGVEKTNALLEHHSDCIDIIERYGRTHHKINVDMFKDNILIKNKDFKEHQYNIQYFE